MLKELIIAYVTFVLVDSIWLRISKKKWQKVNGGVPFEAFPAGLLAYAALAIGVVYVAYPLYLHYSQSMSKEHALLVAGMLVGFTVYFTYDMTNRVVFGKSYPWSLALMDAAWGTFVFPLVLWIYTKFI